MLERMAGMDEVQVRAEDDYEFEGDIADEGTSYCTFNNINASVFSCSCR